MPKFKQLLYENGILFKFSCVSEIRFNNSHSGPFICLCLEIALFSVINPFTVLICDMVNISRYNWHNQRHLDVFNNFEEY